MVRLKLVKTCKGLSSFILNHHPKRKIVASSGSRSSFDFGTTCPIASDSFPTPPSPRLSVSEEDDIEFVTYYDLTPELVSNPEFSYLMVDPISTPSSNSSLAWEYERDSVSNDADEDEDKELRSRGSDISDSTECLGVQANTSDTAKAITLRSIAVGPLGTPQVLSFKHASDSSLSLDNSKLASSASVPLTSRGEKWETLYKIENIPFYQKSLEATQPFPTTDDKSDIVRPNNSNSLTQPSTRPSRQLKRVKSVQDLRASTRVEIQQADRATYNRKRRSGMIGNDHIERHNRMDALSLLRASSSDSLLKLKLSINSFQNSSPGSLVAGSPPLQNELTFLKSNFVEILDYDQIPVNFIQLSTEEEEEEELLEFRRTDRNGRAYTSPDSCGSSSTSATCYVNSRAIKTVRFEERVAYLQSNSSGEETTTTLVEDDVHKRPKTAPFFLGSRFISKKKGIIVSGLHKAVQWN